MTGQPPFEALAAASHPPQAHVTDPLPTRTQDFQRACEVLGIKKVEVAYPGGLKKIGLGRVIDGAKAVETLTAAGKAGGAA